MQDRSQPDVYETSDLPEDEQHLDNQVPVWIFKNLFGHVLLTEKVLIHVILYVHCADYINWCYVTDMSVQ